MATKLKEGMAVRLCSGAVMTDIRKWRGRRIFWEGCLFMRGDHPRLASRDPRKIGSWYPFSPTAVELAAFPAEFEIRSAMQAKGVEA